MPSFLVSLKDTGIPSPSTENISALIPGKMFVASSPDLTRSKSSLNSPSLGCTRSPLSVDSMTARLRIRARASKTRLFPGRNSERMNLTSSSMRTSRSFGGSVVIGRTRSGRKLARASPNTLCRISANRVTADFVATLFRVAEGVDHLQGECLLVGEELHSPRIQCLLDTGLKSKGILRAFLSDATAAVKNRGLEEHLEAVIEQNQHGLSPSAIVGTIEVLNCKDQGV